MIRVLIISPTSEWGGPEAGLLELIRNVDKSQFSLKAVFPSPGPYTAQMEEEGIDVHFAPTAPIEKSQLSWKLLTFGPQLIIGALRTARIANDWKADLLFSNSSASLVGPLAALLARRPHITYAREIRATAPSFITRPMYWCFYHGSARVITLSNAIKQIAFGELDPQKIDVVYDSLDSSWFTAPTGVEALRDELRLRPDQPVVGTVVRLCPPKGAHCFLEAADLVHAQYPEAAFLIVGDVPRPKYQPYKDELLAFVNERNLSGVTRFMGWRSDVKRILALCSVNVLASPVAEGAGRVIPEGWAVGTPPVVPNHTGPAEIVRDGIDGLHFQTGNATDLADKIIKLLSEPETRAAMQREGRKRAEEFFTARRNAKRIEAIWNQVASNPKT